MNICIYGGTGFIGRNFINLYKGKCNIYVVSRDPDCIIDGAIVIQKSDLLNLNFKFDLIFYLKCTLLPRQEEYFIANHLDDQLSDFLILKRMLVINGKFIYFSSAGAVYGNSYKSVDETSKLLPISPYGILKVSGESAAKEIFINPLIIRPTNVYGPYSTINGFQGIIPIFSDNILKSKISIIYSNLNFKKDYIYVSDLIFVVNFLIENDFSGIFNIGSSHLASPEEILNIISKVLCKSSLSKYEVFSGDDIVSIQISLNKINSILPNFVYKDVQDGIKHFLDFRC